MTDPMDAMNRGKADGRSWKALLEYTIACLEKESAFTELIPRVEGRKRFAFSACGFAEQLSGTEDLVASRALEPLASQAAARSEALYCGWPTVLLRNGRPGDRSPTSASCRVAPLLVLEIRTPQAGSALPAELSVLTETPILHPAILAALGFDEESVARLAAEFPPAGSQGSVEILTRYVSDLVDQLGLDVHEALDAGAPSSFDENESDSPGVYNAAMVFTAKNESFHKRLLFELNELREQDPEGTAAGILFGEGSEQSGQGAGEVVAPLPLNESQERALERALEERLVVVTGPPGTGKSQLVTNVIASCWASGQTVLLASTNNQAVDVVAQRADAIDPGLLIRTGNQKHRDAAKEKLLDLTKGPAPTPDLNVLRRNAQRAREHVLAWRARLAERTEIELELAKVRLTTERLRDQARWDLCSCLEGMDPEAAQRILTAAMERIRRRQSLEAEAGALSSTLESLAKDLDWDPASLGREEGSSTLDGFLERARRLGRSRLLKRWRWAAFSRKLGLAKDVSVLPTLCETLETETRRREVERELTRLPECHDTARDVLDRCGAPPPPEMWSALDSLEHIRDLAEFESSWARHRARLDRLNAADALWRLVEEAEHEFRSASRELLGGLIAAGVAEGTSGLREYAQSKTSTRIGVGFQGHFPKALPHLLAWASTSLSIGAAMPLEKGLFDLVVIDEASQCSLVSALPLLFRARRALIIGDPMQLSHIPGITKAQEEACVVSSGVDGEWLAEAHLSHRLHSLYAAFENVADHRMLLDEHYRSHPQIIEMANKLFYGGQLAVLTDPEGLTSVGDNAVAWRDVEGLAVRPSSGSAHNEIEARAVAEQLGVLSRTLPETVSIGVVTPFAAQVRMIESAVREVLPKRWRAKVRLEVGTAHRFQGGERDVIVFSPVLAEGIAETSASWLSGTPNLFNVAITRARSHLLIVGSLRYCRASDGALGELARYVHESRTADRVSAMGARGRLDSLAEERLFEALTDRGVVSEPKVRVGGYACDFLVEGQDTAINLECDGFQHRSSSGRLRRQDLARDRLVEGLGMRVLRVPAWRCLSEPEAVAEELARAVGA